MHISSQSFSTSCGFAQRINVSLHCKSPVKCDRLIFDFLSEILHEFWFPFDALRAIFQKFYHRPHFLHQIFHIWMAIESKLEIFLFPSLWTNHIWCDIWQNWCVKLKEAHWSLSFVKMSTKTPPKLIICPYDKLLWANLAKWFGQVFYVIASEHAIWEEMSSIPDCCLKELSSKSPIAVPTHFQLEYDHSNYLWTFRSCVKVVENCKILTFKVHFLHQKLSESF